MCFSTKMLFTAGQQQLLSGAYSQGTSKSYLKFLSSLVQSIVPIFLSKDQPRNMFLSAIMIDGVAFLSLYKPSLTIDACFAPYAGKAFQYSTDVYYSYLLVIPDVHTMLECSVNTNYSHIGIY